MSLMEMSFSGTVLILVILAVRAALKGRLPKRTFAVLWMVALLRLLIPFSVPSAWSAYTFFQNVVPSLENVILQMGPVSSFVSDISSQLSGDMRSFGNTDPSLTQSGSASGNADARPGQTADSGKNSQPTAFSANISEEMPSETISSAAEQTRSNPSIWKMIWAAGFLISLIFFTWIYGRCFREFQMSLPVETGILGNWRETHPLRRKLSIRQSDQIASPISYGVWHPVILLSKSEKWGDRFRLRYVLEHEYVHIQYFDAAVKLVMVAALCVHWFNPFVYLMYVFFNRDLELACDETVVQRLGEEEKAAYAMALIEMEEEKSGLLPLGNSFSKNAIEERIRAIMKIKKITPLARGMSVALVSGITLVFATSCGTYGEAEKALEASPQAEAVGVQEINEKNNANTKSFSAVLEETRNSSAVIRQTTPDSAEKQDGSLNLQAQKTMTVDESMVGYDRKEIEERIASLNQSIQEMEQELDQITALRETVLDMEEQLSRLADQNRILQDVEKEAGKSTSQEQKENAKQRVELKEQIEEKVTELERLNGRSDTLVEEIEQLQEEIESLRWMESELDLKTFFEENYGEYAIRYDLSEHRLYMDYTPNRRYIRYFIDEKNGGVLWEDNEGEFIVTAVYDKKGKITALSAEKAEAKAESKLESIEETTAGSAAKTTEERTEQAREAAQRAAREAQKKAEEAAQKSVAKELEKIIENNVEKAKEADITAGTALHEDTEYTTDHPYHSAAYMISISDEFGEYKKFGLSYDKKSDYLMYQNQTVGYFKDETKPNVYIRLVEGSGKLGIIVNRDDSRKITEFTVFPFDESSMSDSPVKEGSSVITWDDSGEVESAVIFPYAEQAVLDAYIQEKGDAVYEQADEISAEASSGEATFDEGDPDDAKSSVPKEYAKFGVKLSDEKNNLWIYKGKGVAVIYDKDHWIYNNDTIPEKNAVYLEVIRDKKDQVTELKEVTKKEMQKLFQEE